MKKKSKKPDKKESLEQSASKEDKTSLDRIAKILGVTEDELKKTPGHVLEKLEKISIEESTFYKGPLPPPSILNEYEKILAGSFDRILILLENNARHRIEIDQHEMEIEKSLVPESILLRKSGQNKAFFISILGIIAVVFCAYIDQPAVASILAGTTLTSLVMSFIAGIKKDKDKQDKKG